MIGFETLGNRLRAIVLAAHELRRTTAIALASRLRLLVAVVIPCPALLAAEAAGDAVDHLGVIHFQLDHEIDFFLLGCEHRIERLGLGGRARETVEDEPVRAVLIRDRIADDADHDIVAHQLALGHHLLGLEAQLAARRDGRTQHIASRELGEFERIPQVIRLRPFTSARRPEENDIHAKKLRTRALFTTLETRLFNQRFILVGKQM